MSSKGIRVPAILTPPFVRPALFRGGGSFEASGAGEGAILVERRSVDAAIEVPVMSVGKYDRRSPMAYIFAERAERLNLSKIGLDAKSIEDCKEAWHIEAFDKSESGNR